MKLANYRLADFEGSETVAFGAVRGSEVVRLDAGTNHDHAGLGSVEDYLMGLPETSDRARAILGDQSVPGTPLSRVRLLPALPAPPLVTVCTELGDIVRTEPVIEPTVHGPGDVVPKRYPGGAQYGLRPQLAVVTPNDMPEPTEPVEPAGYVLLTEIVSHDIESGEQRVDVGIGPFLTTPDEIGDPLDLAVTVTVDGSGPWRGNTSSYPIHPKEALFKQLQRQSFRPGSVMGLGRIEGSFGFDGDEWLRPGEVVTIAIDGLGELTLHLGRI